MSSLSLLLVTPTIPKPQNARTVIGIGMRESTQQYKPPKSRASGYVQGAQSKQDADAILQTLGELSLSRKQIGERLRWPDNRLRNAMEWLAREKLIIYLGAAPVGVWRAERRDKCGEQI